MRKPQEDNEYVEFGGVEQRSKILGVTEVATTVSYWKIFYVFPLSMIFGHNKMWRNGALIF